MQTILDEGVAEQLTKGAIFTHRFDEAGRTFIKRMHDQASWLSLHFSWVKDYEYDFAFQLKGDAPEYITIDTLTVTQIVIQMIQHIKKELPDTFVPMQEMSEPRGRSWVGKRWADATKVELTWQGLHHKKWRLVFGTGGWQS